MRFLFLITLTFLITHSSFAAESDGNNFVFQLDKDTYPICSSFFSINEDTISFIRLSDSKYMTIKEDGTIIPSENNEELRSTLNLDNLNLTTPRTIYSNNSSAILLRDSPNRMVHTFGDKASINKIINTVGMDISRSISRESSKDLNGTSSNSTTILPKGFRKTVILDMLSATLYDSGRLAIYGDVINDKGEKKYSKFSELKDIIDIKFTSTKIAALTKDGKVIIISLYNTFKTLNNIDNAIAIASNAGTFAILRADGSVVTLGPSNMSYSTCPSETAEKLKSGVIKILANDYAFVAFKDDGTVVSWGYPEFGGDSSQVSHKLTNIKTICIDTFGFYALREDGTVIHWGRQYDEKNPINVDNLVGIKAIYSAVDAFVAVKEDGSIVTMGNDSIIRDNLLEYVKLVIKAPQKELINGNGEAILDNNGHLSLFKFTNGIQQNSILMYELDEIADIRTTSYEVIALTKDGKVIVWNTHSAKLEPVPDLDNVIAIESNAGAFAALRSDGSVFISGKKDYSYSRHTLETLEKLKSGVIKILSNNYAFVALKDDGTVVSWGCSTPGGDSSILSNKLVNVKTIYANHDAFVALTHDGKAISWGDELNGGGYQLNNVKKIYIDKYVFIALTEDNQLIIMGDTYFAKDLLDKIQAENKVSMEQQTDSKSSTSEPSQTLVIRESKRIYTDDGVAKLHGDGNLSLYKLKKTKHEELSYNLEDIVDICVASTEFIALTKDGKVIIWKPYLDDEPKTVPELESGVVKIFATDEGFCALKGDGTVISWEDTGLELVSSKFTKKLDNVKTIYVNNGAFVALTHDGKAISWGDKEFGGNRKIRNVKKIYVNDYVFIAVTKNNKIKIMGDKEWAEDLLEHVKRDLDN